MGVPDFVSRSSEVRDDAATSIAQLRRQMAIMSGQQDRLSVDLTDPADNALPLPEALGDLLPHRGMARGTVTAFDGARSTLVATIASVTRAGGQVGIVGLGQLSLLSAVEMGAVLSRIATVPDPGADPVEVATVLLDGMDLVILDLRGVDVPPTRARVVMGRLRKQSAALVVTGGRWPGAQSRIESKITAYRHLPAEDRTGPDASTAPYRNGYGRIFGMRLLVTATTRGRHRQAGIDLVSSGYGPSRRLQISRSDDQTHPDRSRPTLAVAN